MAGFSGMVRRALWVLGLAHLDLAADSAHGGQHPNYPGVQVDPVPLQCQSFPTAQAGVGDQLQNG